MYQRAFSLCLFAFSWSSLATGLSFWESSATNTALAAANGAIAQDSSVIALAPSSITQLQQSNLDVSVIRYHVTTDYKIFGTTSQYEAENLIPSFFMSSALNDAFYVGLGIYSRTAVDISTPEIGTSRKPVFYETHVKPIVVSATPVLAYRWNTLSAAIGIEYMRTNYLLEQTRRAFRKDDEYVEIEGTTEGWSGMLSMTWMPQTYVSVSAKYQGKSDFGDEQVTFDLPAITSLYASFELMKSWMLNTSYSYTDWDEKGVRFNEYPDPFGLLVGSQDSQRFAVSTSYELYNWLFMLGYSQDEEVDVLGGQDKRYRLGLRYGVTTNWSFTVTWMHERYEEKKYDFESVNLVSVKNTGNSGSLGVHYAW